MDIFKDFHTVNDIKFDILKLQKSLNDVLKIKNYDDANGIKNFAAICLNQIPGKPESTTGTYARGVYWTKPDHKGNRANSDLVGKLSQASRVMLNLTTMGEVKGEARLPVTEWLY